MGKINNNLMRMRRKPWARPELAICNYFVPSPMAYKNHWKEHFDNPSLPLHIELGCGKGVFLANKLKLEEEKNEGNKVNYIAIDIKSDVLGYARRNIEPIKKYGNVLLTAYNIEQILNIFGENDKVQRIYINFCNPWPKPAHNKRRLTHSKQLKLYKTFLEKNGEIFFKTDDENLYLATKKYLEESGFEIYYDTIDLYEDKNEEKIPTEHEIMFTEKGIKIKAIKARLI